ncbi:MAG: antitoxin family protein [Acidobacteriota bacterium]
MIRARVRGGVLEPLEDIRLPEGREVTVTIAEALIRHIYAERRTLRA